MNTTFIIFEAQIKVEVKKIQTKKNIRVHHSHMYIPVYVYTILYILPYNWSMYKL